MIDAAQSLEVARTIEITKFMTYLLANGWASEISRARDFLIVSKIFEGADQPAFFILPTQAGSDDEDRRIADALRTLEVLEGRASKSIADDISLLETEQDAADRSDTALSAGHEALTASLTEREREVMKLVVRGLSNKNVARSLGLSEGTVKIHLHNIYGKTGAWHRASLAEIARTGLDPQRRHDVKKD